MLDTPWQWQHWNQQIYDSSTPVSHETFLHTTGRLSHWGKPWQGRPSDQAIFLLCYMWDAIFGHIWLFLCFSGHRRSHTWSCQHHDLPARSWWLKCDLAHRRLHDLSSSHMSHHDSSLFSHTSHHNSYLQVTMTLNVDSFHFIMTQIVTNQCIGPQWTNTGPPCYKGNKCRMHPFGFPTSLGPDRLREIHTVIP